MSFRFLFYIFCSFFSFFFLFFKSAPPFTEHTFFLFFCSGPSSFFSESRRLCEKEIFYSCQFCCFKTNANFKKKKEKKNKSLLLFPRSLLEHRWTSLMISGYCLVLVPYLSSTFPKHGLYIHEYIDIHSPRESRTQCADAVAGVCSSLMLQPAAVSRRETLHSAPVAHCIFLMGLFQISVKLLQ